MRTPAEVRMTAVGTLGAETSLHGPHPVAPLRPLAAATPEAARLRALLRAGSIGSMSWMATWAGNRPWFTADGRHAIAVRAGGGVALALGEPIGERDGAERAAREFVRACRDRGFVPAFHVVRTELAEAVSTDAAWVRIPLGEDAVVDPTGVTLRGRRWQDVRGSVNRASRVGLHAAWTTWAQLAPEQRDRVRDVDEAWHARLRMPALRFTVGGVAEAADPEVRLVLALDSRGDVHAVTSWLPTWRGGRLVGLTLDLVRRGPDAMNGVVEFLIAEVLAAGRRDGLEFVSLSVMPLADREELPLPLAAASRLAEPLYGFRSLAAFKRKFLPRGVPQVLAVPGRAAVPAVALALSRAYLLPPPAARRHVGAREGIGPRRSAR